MQRELFPEYQNSESGKEGGGDKDIVLDDSSNGDDGFGIWQLAEKHPQVEIFPIPWGLSVQNVLLRVRQMPDCAFLVNAYRQKYGVREYICLTDGRSGGLFHLCCVCCDNWMAGLSENQVSELRKNKREGETKMDWFDVVARVAENIGVNMVFMRKGGGSLSPRVRLKGGCDHRYILKQRYTDEVIAEGLNFIDYDRSYLGSTYF